MFEKTTIGQRYSAGERRVLGVHLGYVPELDEDEGQEKRGVRLAIGIALAVHVVFFLLQLPELRAVELGPEDGNSLDSRALARALTGDPQGAAADFRTALALKAAEEDWDPAVRERRERWIPALEKGKNPVLEEFEEFRIDPVEVGLLWRF